MKLDVVSVGLWAPRSWRLPRPGGDEGLHRLRGVRGRGAARGTLRHSGDVVKKHGGHAAEEVRQLFGDARRLTLDVRYLTIFI